MLLSVTLGRPHPEPGSRDAGILEPVQKGSREGCGSPGHGWVMPKAKKAEIRRTGACCVSSMTSDGHHFSEP